jgi:PAS domain S-box-containing protein
MQPTQSCKVLVVEDEGLIALDIASRLEALGHEVIGTVGTAAEAMEKAAGADIVLMDIRIDGPVDGIQAAENIRQRFHVPVIFLTGQADRATIERAKLAEPFGYIVKPLAPASLQTSIEIAVYKHRMQRMLEEREAWLSTTFSSVADAVIVTGIDSRVRMLNRAAEVLTGWIQPEAEGQLLSTIVRLMDKDSDQEAEDPVPLAIVRDAPVPLDAWSLVSRSGREMSIEGAAAPVKASGVILGVVLTLRDVSARRWEERQLRQSQKLEAAGRLAAGVCGDYANLLAMIRGQAERLLLQFGEYAPARQAVEEIQQAATAAEQITRRLASLGARQVRHPEVVSLNTILRRAARPIESVAGPGIEVAIRPQMSAGRIKADAAQIEQAIMNLVIHACARMSESETPEGGRLLIETGNAEIPVNGRLSSYVMLSITHTAHEPDLEKLFEPVSAGDGNLALPLVHTIVTEHAGYVSARSTAGGGCRFEMLLPHWSAPILLPRPTCDEAPAVLLVDHRESVRSQLHNFFETNGYNLLEAADHGEAVALGQMHEGTLRLVIAEASQADAILHELRPAHPGVVVLRIVDGPAAAVDQVQQPFTQQALLERVEALLGPALRLESATAG